MVNERVMKDAITDKAQAAVEQLRPALDVRAAARRRALVLRRPDAVGLAYDDVEIPSIEGVPLEGWSLRAESDRLLIDNHVLHLGLPRDHQRRGRRCRSTA